MTAKPIYKRVLLKASGEALMGSQGFGIDVAVADRIAGEIAAARAMGVEVGVVVGGGNIFRGVAVASKGGDRVTGDHMGMLATVINALALATSLRKLNIETVVLSAIAMPEICESFSQRATLYHLSLGRVVIFAGGTGNPFFTTDTAASLRGAEIGAEVVLKATKVDGVYTADPMKDPTATRYTRLSFDEAIGRHLGIMDATAFALCRDQKLPIRVFSIVKPGALMRVVMGEDEGTLVTA